MDKRVSSSVNHPPYFDGKDYSQGKNKSITLSTVKEEKEPESSDCCIEDFAYLTKQFEKFLNKMKPFGSSRNFSKDASSTSTYPRNSDSSPARNPRSTLNLKSFQKDDKYFEFGRVGHRAVKCPTRKNREIKSLKTTWSDNDSEQSSNHDDEGETVAFVASLSLGDFHDDNDIDDSIHEKYTQLCTASKSMLSRVETLTNELSKSEESISGMQDKLQSQKVEWKAEKASLENNVKTLQESLDTQNKLVRTLTSEKLGLEKELLESKKQFEKFSIGSDKLSKMVGMGKPAKDKRGLGFETGQCSNFSGQTVFVKSKEPIRLEPPKQVKINKRFVPTCHHCGVVGHIRPRCWKLTKNQPRSKMPQGSELLNSFQASLKKSLKEFSRIAQGLSLPRSSEQVRKPSWVKKKGVKPHHSNVSHTDTKPFDICGHDSNEDEQVCFLSRVCVEPASKDRMVTLSNVAINDGVMCSHESGCMTEQEPTPNVSNASTEGISPAPVIPEEDSSDEDGNLAEGRRDQTIAIPSPHRAGSHQVQKDHFPSDIIGEVHEPRKTRTKLKLSTLLQEAVVPNLCG